MNEKKEITIETAPHHDESLEPIEEYKESMLRNLSYIKFSMHIELYKNYSCDSIVY